MDIEDKTREAFEKYMKNSGITLRHMPENMRSLCNNCWYYSAHHNDMLRAYKAATAAAEEKYLGVIEEMRGALEIYQSCDDEVVRLLKGFKANACTIDENSIARKALAASLVKEGRRCLMD
jgi:hypothetical protein